MVNIWFIWIQISSLTTDHYWTLVYLTLWHLVETRNPGEYPELDELNDIYSINTQTDILYYFQYKKPFFYLYSF